ncbi:DUF3631 domain-containing protein [Crateriforma spongiae]|uniref:DUF3631 domain-containing protein n=1 Tax=Crateriforma spongiae TaxID=2724528 RepID=UPI0014461167|nr:DUF3631 domain-containing protein [Crateriforma spongiae]
MADFIGTYIVMPDDARIVMASWILASHIIDSFDRFPHLAITSPEKRCGKTRCLQLIELLSREAVMTSNMSPAVVYRLIEEKKPTLIMDEAQSLSRQGSENSIAIQEIFCAAIDRNAAVHRVGGDRNDEIVQFRVYSPKVVALIGNLDGVLADRCVEVRLARKTADDSVTRFRSRVVEPDAEKVRESIVAWCTDHAGRVAEAYDTTDEFDIANDRMAELMLPLQSVVMVDDEESLPALRRFVFELEEQDRQAELSTPGVKLLIAAREIFDRVKPDENGGKFLLTKNLIRKLVAREEEEWQRFSSGRPISADAIARLLRPYGIRSSRDRTRRKRGYWAHDFDSTWERYAPRTPSP